MKKINLQKMKFINGQQKINNYEILQGNLIILQKYYKKQKIYDKLMSGDENGYKRKF